jgi:hypothetical protein
MVVFITLKIYAKIGVEKGGRKERLIFLLPLLHKTVSASVRYVDDLNEFFKSFNVLSPGVVYTNYNGI